MIPNPAGKQEVFLVARGQYSDYRIEGAFSTEDKAEAYADVLNACRSYEEAGVECYMLDPELPKIAEYVTVWISKGGDVKRIEGPETRIINETRIRYWFTRMVWLDGALEKEPYLQLIVETDSEERAIKVASEKRAQIVAAGTWNDPDATEALFSSLSTWRCDHCGRENAYDDLTCAGCQAGKVRAD